MPVLTKEDPEALHPDDQAALAWVESAHKGQRPPVGAWRTWVFLGGRGAGKTRAGAEWVSEVAARLGAGGRIALVGATLHDVRSVMVEGPSGLMNLPFRAPPRLESSLRRLVFPGGAVGVMLSAAEPERLRGPQFHAAWGDEFCAWEKADYALAMLGMGLRLGGATARDAVARCLSAEESRGDWTPRLMLTTTPKPFAVLRRVLAEEGCVRTHAPTGANAGNLAGGFLEAMQALYGGTRRAAQELDGVVLEAEGALFTHAEMARARALCAGYRPSDDLSPGPGRAGLPTFERAVVAVDPPVGTLSGEGGDACGIVVVARSRLRGNDEAGTAWVLDDRSVRGLSPAGWAARVAKTAKDWEAALGCPVRVVAEGNQGGDMVEAVLKGAGVTQVVRRVQARVGKRARAEPVAALYEQGRVGHVGELTLLEEELLGMGEQGGGSPDRADALVWAVTDLLIDGGGVVMPRARAL